MNVEDAARSEAPVGVHRRGGFWLVMLLLFGPLAVVVVLQFTSEENRYINPQRALDIAAEEQGLDAPPEVWELTFDQTPPAPFAHTSAVWHVRSPHSVEPRLLIEMTIDAESGKVLGRATFGG